MGVFIKNDLEKILKDAEKKALIPDQNDALSSYGDRMRHQMAVMMGREKLFGQHLEGTVSGGSFILSPFNRLSKRGRAFEDTMDRQKDEKYMGRFTETIHKTRLKEEHELNPDDPFYQGVYNPREPEYIQDVPIVKDRNGFATHRGKNDVVVDLVLTGRMYTEELDKGGFKRRVLAPYGFMDMMRDSVFTGQRSGAPNVPVDPNITQAEMNHKFHRMKDSIDNFQVAFQKRVDAADAINKARLEELGYKLLDRDDDNYVAQQMEIAGDPRFIEVFPDLTDLPKIVGDDGHTYEPEYDIVIHINGQKVQPQDIDLAFQQLTRKGAYEKTGLETSRDFLVQQGIRGAAFHASVLPQQMTSKVIHAPAKLAQEGQQAVTSTVIQHLMQALSRGMSR